MRVHPSPAPSPHAQSGEHIALIRLAHGWRIEIVSVDRETGRVARTPPIHEQTESDARRVAGNIAAAMNIPIQETP
jgi:hypothetical protein